MENMELVEHCKYASLYLGFCVSSFPELGFQCLLSLHLSFSCWMAPELLTGRTSNTAMSDVRMPRTFRERLKTETEKAYSLLLSVYQIYALGVLLYEVYSHKRPYEDDKNLEQVVRDVCDQAVRKRPTIPTMCPPKVAKLMNDCFQHNPHDRPTAKEVDSVLQAEGTVQGRVFRVETLNQQLAESNRRIAIEHSAQLGHFASISHELRTPLN